MDQVQFPTTVKRQLDRVFRRPIPENRYAEFVQQYLNRVKAGSTTPVVFLWLPQHCDLKWGVKQIVGKESGVGHAASAWGGEYASFWPFYNQQTDRYQNNGIGTWHTFADDLRDEKRLPDLIYKDLSSENQMRFLGMPIKSWNLNQLSQAFASMQHASPIFDLKGRGNTYNCSKMALSIVQEGIETDFFGSLKIEWNRTKQDVTSNSWLQKFKGIVKSPFRALTGVSNTLRTTVYSPVNRLWKGLRQNNSINPNVVSKAFHRNGLGIGDVVLSPEEGEHYYSNHFVGSVFLFDDVQPYTSCGRDLRMVPVGL